MIPTPAPASPSCLVTIASLVEQQHQPHLPPTSYRPGTCKQCTPDGCPLMSWARPVLADYRSTRTAYRLVVAR